MVCYWCHKAIDKPWKVIKAFRQTYAFCREDHYTKFKALEFGK